MRADLDRFRKELNSDYIDILLLHCMTDGNWNEEKRGAMDVISEAQDRGLVRTKGVSCHTLNALKTAAAEPWAKVDLARINPAGVAMDADPATVIGVKIFGAGKIRDKTDECLQFALSPDCVDAFIIGSESLEELEQLMTKIPNASVRG